MPTYLLLNKPFQVLTQFTDPEGRETLAKYISTPGIYSAGRLDYDSEGLLLLTDDGALTHAMMDPKHKVPKTYYAQVEGLPSDESLLQLQSGVELKDGITKPCEAMIVDEPIWLWERNPPIRERKNIPTSWIKLTITEGKNRQVRRMTAAVGHPTLRLVRFSIGKLRLDDLKPGESRIIDKQLLADNGIKWKAKKSSPKTAFTSKKSPKRPDQRRHRSRPNQNQSRTNGKTQPDNLKNR